MRGHFVDDAFVNSVPGFLVACGADSCPDFGGHSRPAPCTAQDFGKSRVLFRLSFDAIDEGWTVLAEEIFDFAGCQHLIGAEGVIGADDYKYELPEGFGVFPA